MELAQLKLGIYEKAIPLELSWREKLKLAKDSGFDFVELSIDGLEPRVSRLDWSEAEIDDLRHATEETGVPILTMAMSGNRQYPLGDDRIAIRTQGILLVQKAVDLAVKLGIRLIQLAAYDVVDRPSTAQTDRFFRQSLTLCTQYAASRGVMLSLEIMDCDYSNTSVKLLDLISHIPSPFIQVYYDCANPAGVGIDPAQDVKYAAGRIVACHLKDAKPGRVRKIPFGEGIVDFDAFLSALLHIGYTGLLVVEMWSDEDMAFVPYLKEASLFLRQKMNKIK